MVAQLALAGAALAVSCTSALVQGPWSDQTKDPQQRAWLLVHNMTLEEKLSLLHGGDSPYVGSIQPVPRLGIPPVHLNDGPQGFRHDKYPRSSTAWPSGLTMAASWDPEAVFEWGAGMGKEFYGKGSNLQLGPGVNVARVPWNGRNFEYLSGEDPFLGYTLVKPAVRGIQSQKVVANVKHWVLNNQERNRGMVSAEADERTRFEIYYPPFEGAIEAGVGSLMCGYNKINGAWSCENPKILGELKRLLGFKGYVMSDWGATHSMSLAAGLDNEQPSVKWHRAELLVAALEAGTVTPAMVDEAAVRILWSMLSVGVMDEPASAWDPSKINNNVTNNVSVASARRLSAVSTVLLKNEGGVLPLSRSSGSVAVLGLADERAITHGGGSGSVVPSYVSTPLEGIRAAAGGNVSVAFDDGLDMDSAVEVATHADVVVIFAGTTSCEGADRESLSLDFSTETEYDNQNALISAVAKVSKRVIVVLSVPGPILMPWSRDVEAILTNFMPGQQVGNAIADVLFGHVNPSGKLPVTFPNAENEINFGTDQWPGLGDWTFPDYVFYKEKLLVGYRYYEANNISFVTGFPFGHGISYTTFTLSNLQTLMFTEGVNVSFTVQNIGAVAGAEVPQLYLSFPASAAEPPRQLKGFQKTQTLQPGESQNIVLHVRLRDMSIWDEVSHDWRVVEGTFSASVGFSSRDLRLHSSFESPHFAPLFS